MIFPRLLPVLLAAWHMTGAVCLKMGYLQAMNSPSFRIDFIKNVVITQDMAHVKHNEMLIDHTYRWQFLICLAFGQRHQPFQFA
jgi:hypothetical protein